MKGFIELILASMTLPKLIYRPTMYPFPSEICSFPTGCPAINDCGALTHTASSIHCRIPHGLDARHSLMGPLGPAENGYSGTPYAYSPPTQCWQAAYEGIRDPQALVPRAPRQPRLRTPASLRSRRPPSQWPTCNTILPMFELDSMYLCAPTTSVHSNTESTTGVMRPVSKPSPTKSWRAWVS
jgi:hypothetical protein